MTFGRRPSLLQDTALDPGDIGPSPTGIVPRFTTGPITDPNTLGSIREENDAFPQSVDTNQLDSSFEGLVEGAGDLASQCDPETQTCISDTPRGIPETPDERPRFREKGEARIRALTEMFGPDALVLGHLLFKVPPLAIRIKKGNITYRWKPLRTKESIAVKSGSGECYIEIDLVFVGINQIQNSLSELIALWKKIPFCFIENTHIRKMMTPNSPDESMAVCLETMVMDAISGRPNTVYVTLVTKWFNYKPYSRNFWFRKEWEPVEDSRVRQNETGDGGPDAGRGSEGASEGGSESPPPDPDRTILVDLSAIQDSNVFSYMSTDLPAEVGLLEAKQMTNPGDPTIEGTYPVVYPFNSTPFLQRVRTGEDSPVRIRGWSDGIQMQWNSFIRMNVPRSWQYSMSREPEISTAISRPRSRQAGGGRSSGGRIPPAVTGDRNIVIFIGDSIMVGMTRQTSTDGTSPGDSGTPFFQWAGNSRFPKKDGFTYYGMMKVGANSRTMLSWWNAKKNDSAFKASGNNSPCSAVAGVLIHAGTNDGYNGPYIDALSSIMEEASSFGAIPILCSLPPIGNASHLTIPMLSHANLFSGWSVAIANAYFVKLPDYHSQMQKIVSDIDNAVMIDTHNKMVDPAFRGNRAAPLAEKYMNKNSPQTGYYNVHWGQDSTINSSETGYAAGGNYVHSEMPWNSLSGISPPAQETSDLWTVCSVEDGDSLWVWGNDPNSGARVLRNIRMQYIDTPETYAIFSNSDYNEGGANPMPEGQDSYRPENAKFGLIAKNALSDLLPFGSQVKITWGDKDVYNRNLAVIFKGRDNINLLMVKQGYAFAMIPRNPDNELGEQEIGFDYERAELEAKGQWPRNNPSNGPRGIWNRKKEILTGVPDAFSSTVRAALETLMKPSDYRRTYAPDSSGGHEGTPSECTEEPTR